MPNDTTDQPTLAVTSEPDWLNAETCIENAQIAYDDASEADPFQDGNPIPIDTVVDAGDLGVLIDLARYASAHRTNSEPRAAGDLREAKLVGYRLQGPDGEDYFNETVTPLSDQDRANGWIETPLYTLATHSPAPMAGWQDMGDAPKDGSHILAWFWSSLTGRSYGWADTIRWWNGMWWDDRDGPCEPVAWMPRPAPPVAHPSTQEG